MANEKHCAVVVTVVETFVAAGPAVSMLTVLAGLLRGDRVYLANARLC